MARKADRAEVTVTGYAFSVYTRSLLIALAEKAVPHAYVECDPFDPVDATTLRDKHPFGRVPVLDHGNFRLWETAAMLDYVQAAFTGPSLVPDDAKAAARMRQAIAVMDNYGYWPLVRQVFSHGVFRPLKGEDVDEYALQSGLEAAPRVLNALEGIAAEGLVLVPGRVCLAACHLLPFLEYFTMLPEGRDMLDRFRALSVWLDWMSGRPPAAKTRPVMPPVMPPGTARAR